MLVAVAVQNTQGRSERQRHVGARIAVRDRKDIDTVQELLLAEYAMDAGAQRYRKRVPVKVFGSVVRQGSRA